MKTLFVLPAILAVLFSNVLNTEICNGTEYFRYERIAELNDSIIIGMSYTLGTASKRQYIGKVLSMDSLYIRIETDDGIKKLLLKDIKIIKQNRSLPELINTNDSLNLYNIELNDGNEINGYIISKDSLSVTIKTGSDIIMILPLDKIKSISKSRIELVNGEYLLNDPNDNRLFISPTARPISKNTAFLSNTELFFPMAGAGIEDYVSLSGGISIFPTAVQLFYFNVKVTPVKIKYADLAAGFLYANITDGGSALGIVYGLGTFGTKKAAFTAGFGIDVVSESKDKTSILMLGGEVRASNKVKFLMESWIFFNTEDTPSFTMVGLRFFGSNLAADFGLLKIWDAEASNDSWPFYPVVSFTYNFGL